MTYKCLTLNNGFSHYESLPHKATIDFPTSSELRTLNMLEEDQIRTKAQSSTVQVSILIALESELVRCGIFNMLQDVPSVSGVWSCSGPVASHKLIAEHRPDIVICQANQLLASALVQEVEEFSARILLLLDDLRLDDIDETVMLSSHGFIMQQELTSASLDTAISKVASGDMPLPAGMARTLMARMRGNASPGSVYKFSLTPREQQVLALLAQGCSNKQIARRIGVSEHGAKRHVTNILAKLNAPNRTLAVALALQEGVL